MRTNLIPNLNRRFLKEILMLFGVFTLQVGTIQNATAAYAVGQIQDWYIHRDTQPGQSTDNAVLILTMVTNPSGALTCTYGSKRYAIRLSNNAGRSIYQTVMLARAMGQNISIWGTGSCSDWPDAEGIVWLNINP